MTGPGDEGEAAMPHDRKEMLAWLQPILTALTIAGIITVISQQNATSVAIAEIKKDVGYQSQAINELKAASKDNVTVGMLNEKLAALKSAIDQERMKAQADLSDVQNRLMLIERFQPPGQRIGTENPREGRN